MQLSFLPNAEAHQEEHWLQLKEFATAWQAWREVTSDASVSSKFHANKNQYSIERNSSTRS